MTKLHARFDGRVLIPDEPVDLPKGRKLEVQVTEFSASGSIQALLDMMRQSPSLSSEEVAEMESAIESGKLPTSQPTMFDGE